MKIGNREFDVKNKTYIMGILNVTPDSFSDGGLWNTELGASNHGVQMATQGAAVIDVGGESTRPGARRVSADEEWERVRFDPGLRSYDLLAHEGSRSTMDDA